MKIKHVHIQNFRGIKELDWTIPQDVVCLIGKGDSTKSSIIKAIEYALYPTYNLRIIDSDFFNCDVSEDILVEISLSDLPEDVLKWNKEGLFLRGWDSANAQIVDEPDISSGHDYLLTVKFIVSSDLEPSWEIYNDRLIEPKPLSHKERALFGMYSIGSYVESDLTLSRSSVVTRILDNSDEVKKVLADLRTSLKSDDFISSAPLEAISTEIEENAADYGVDLKSDVGFKTSLGNLVGFSGSTLRLFNKSAPLSSFGTGSKKLLAVSLHKQLASSGGILLLDEIEQGLEPHRLRHLVTKLQNDISKGVLGQVFTATHSPVALEEFEAKNIFVVRNEDGVTTVSNVPNELQPIVRSASEAMLSKNIIVGEGKTEIGFILALNDHNQKNLGMPSFALLATHLVDGGGDSYAYKRAEKLNSLGYNVCLMLDDDNKSFHKDISLLESQGVKVIRWNSGSNIELSVLESASDSLVDELLAYVVSSKSSASLFSWVANETSQSLDISTPPTIEGLSGGLSISKSECKALLGKLFHLNEVFKNIDKGRVLGSIVLKHIAELDLASDIVIKLTEFGVWCYGNSYKL